MIYAFDQYEVDTQLYELRRDGTPVPLEPQVFTVLAYLVEHHDRVVIKNELIDHVWPERFISEAALTTRLMAARKAVGDSGQEQRYIKTVHGRGYRFVGEVRDGSNGVNLARSLAPTADVPAVPQGAMPAPDVRFVRAPDGVRIAYATSGEGPPLVKTANWLSHLEYDWRSPIWRHWITELSRDHTLVRYDERGCGLSDRDVGDYSIDAWVCDLEAVVDTLGLEQFPLLGISQGGPVAITYAFRHPERVSHLILYGTYALGRVKRARTQDEIDEHYALNTLIRRWWGRNDSTFRQIFAQAFVPDANAEQMRWFDDLCRVSASPENAAAFRSAFGMLDVSELAPKVAVPTLVLHVTNDQSIPVEWGRRLAAEIPDARFVEIEGRNHIILESEPAWPRFLTEVRRFLGIPYGDASPLSSSVHTILFTDLEDSTGLTRRLGDHAARELLRQLEVEVRGLVSLHGGGDVKGMGDGIMASFKAPVRALECAVAIQRASTRLAELRGTPLRVRIGLHTGEAISEAGDLHGIAVITASRISDAATGGEILISDEVRTFTASKGFEFGDVREFVPEGFEQGIHAHKVEWAT